MDQIVAVILTLNEEKHIAACIETVQWCDAIVVWDSYSTDRTCEISRQMGARVIQHPFHGYGNQRQSAMQGILAEWVLFVDADERVTPQLADEIAQVLRERPKVVGWWIPRHNYILGKLALYAGWYPDYQMRLLRPDRSRWDPERQVHELAILDGPDGYLTQVLVHHNYESLSQFKRTQDRYTDIDAQILLNRGTKPNWWSPITMLLRHFWWRYVTLRGYKGGFHGLWLSAAMSYYESAKYVRLARLWRQKTGLTT